MSIFFCKFLVRKTSLYKASILEEKMVIKMAQEYAKKFYNSSAWIKTANRYKKSKFYLCEKCNKQGYIVHHVMPITPANINDTNITLNTNNLMLLCTSCHNTIHSTQQRKAVFDEDGNMVDIKEPLYKKV